ncbi:MAG: RecX family transcriptional regulator [Alistipes sp.]|nr:RecX family transcriptional regulator [Alistipes sp.]
MLSKSLKPKRTKSPEQALAALMRLAARSEKSSGDALRLMQNWGVDPSARQGVLQRLIDDKFIDDRRYAEAFVRDKMRFSGWGVFKLRAALRNKGISTDIVEDVLRMLDSNNMADRLRERLERKMRTTKYTTRYDLKTKLMRYGASLGYDFESVGDVVDTLISEIEE